MAEEITRTVENVDRLFSEIVVNGESHVSENYVPPVQLGQQNVANTSPVEETQGEDVYGVKLNDILHNLKDQATAQDLTDEITARQNADTAIEQDVTALQGAVSTIQSEIPNQASSSNQLADKNFVNSSIATNTANFLGTYTSLADIEAIPNPTNNDYAFLETTDSAGNTLYDRYKYSGEDEEWLFEYELNNSGFTAEQWATINSGLTQSSVDQDIADAIAGIAVPTKVTVSANRTDTVQGDMQYFIDTASVVLTLSFGSTNRMKAEIFAIEACSVTYYTDASTTATLSMLAGTSATLVYFNGWKFNGTYGAVWN